MTPDVPDVDAILERVDFDAEANVLTRRQAEVLALRERGLSQAAIADRLGTSRANVSSVETSARRNVERAEETVAVAELLRAPIQVQVEPGADLYDVPDRVYAACDDRDLKVDASTPELLSRVSDGAGEALDGRRFVASVTVAVTPDGSVHVRGD